MELLMFFLAGVAEAHMDTLQFHFYRSRFSSFNHAFWNPEISWRNKYKLNDPRYGAKFPGSTTIFVFVTDAWHLMKFLRNIFLFVGLFFALGENYGNLIDAIIITIVCRGVYGLGFSAFMNRLLRY